MQTKLRDKTLFLLQNRSVKLTYSAISEATGISERWLKAFATSKSKDGPSAKIETLYEFLSGKNLEV